MSAQGNGITLKGAPLDPSIALKPCDYESVGAHAEKISKLASSISPEDDKTRLELAETARKLVRALETPRETMIKHCWAQTATMAALTVGVDMGLFNIMAEDGGKSKKSADLAKAVGADPTLVARLLRHLGAMGYVEETDVDEYKPTNFTKSLTIPIIYAGYPVLSGGLLSANNLFHEYLRQNGYKTPTDLSDGALQYAYKTKNNMFEHLQANQPYGDLFNLHMGGYHQGRASWMDAGFFPVQERLIDGADKSSSSPFLVDIGGSIGHDIQEFLHKYPSAPGRLVLQDLQPVLDKITTLDSRIEVMTHNFLQEQPIKGSRAYYMHSVLHDWPDVEALKILARVKEAMKPGYSKVLINENVIPPRNATWEATGLDILMMTLLASRERTEQDWRHLLGEAGLKITKIWTVANGVESLIECELA
ncbi:S-adenosyl-L-methionine-dependent methyltransferase [Annulohypoxylon truncatum]|uniref:S-adenosyl-L-methionine-dependent methyltransferase n=1 Tax=Annulohypoxylon truncatum TaxID=327061 RepID=UPI002008C90F|nr:S-adenosyl-L-methionine-dependent methyltransferase [Annulohypoxylon truncatum]KAI1214680.1 S-adenosyl-L-methionine-dependent methyltransferase [Annulohypoxylon truncatum]